MRERPAPAGDAGTGAGPTRRRDRPGVDTRLGAGDLAFGVDLLHRLCARHPGGNVLVSPLSVSGALDLAYAGAGGATAAQFGALLHQPAYGPALEAALAGRRARLAPLRGQLQQYDTVWADRGLPLRAGYLDRIRTAAGAGVHRADFAGHADAARQAVNADVRQHTGGLVPELLPAGSVDSSTGAVLTDTVHLDARLAAPMDPTETDPGASMRPAATSRPATCERPPP